MTEYGFPVFTLCSVVLDLLPLTQDVSGTQAVSFHQLGVAAFFQDNSALLDLVNSQVLAKPLICLGDGHDGIWNLFREIGEKQERIEILDW